MLERPANFRINPHAPLANGLMFAGLGAMAGSTHYHDSSVFGSHGALTNMEPATDWVWSPELERYSLDFLTASTQYVATPIPQSSLVSGAWSFASWFRLPSVGTYGLFGTGNATVWGLYARNSSADLRFNSGSNTTDAVSSITTNTWYHVAIIGKNVYGGISNRATIFVNGKYFKDGDYGVGVSQADVLRIGWAISASYTMTGKIADPVFHQRALSLAEIQQLADPSNVMLSGLILPPARKWWPVVSGTPAAASYWLWARQHNSQVIGGGVS